MDSRCGQRNSSSTQVKTMSVWAAALTGVPPRVVSAPAMSAGTPAARRPTLGSPGKHLVSDRVPRKCRLEPRLKSELALPCEKLERTPAVRVATEGVTWTRLLF